MVSHEQGQSSHPTGTRAEAGAVAADRKSTRLNSSHSQISYAVFCLKKKNNVNASALDEKWIGAGGDVDAPVLLTLVTGTGGCVIYGRRLCPVVVGLLAGVVSAYARL